MGREAANPNNKDLMDIIMYLVPQLRWINLLYKVAFNHLIYVLLQKICVRNSQLREFLQIL